MLPQEAVLASLPSYYTITSAAVWLMCIVWNDGLYVTYRSMTLNFQNMMKLDNQVL